MMRLVNRFLWWCAGTNVDILEKCPTEHSKYFGVGGTIVFTALMASFAGGYAFFTAFKSAGLAIAFGIFWGLLIFNLDRYIVSTIGLGDGTSKITKEEWTVAMPRLMMAILLGFVIATPLELKIFETEIKTVVERLKIEKAEELRSRDTSFHAEFEQARNRLAKVETDLNVLTNSKQELSENAGRFFEERRGELIQDGKQKDAELKVVQGRVNEYHRSYMIAMRDSLSSSEIRKRKYLHNKELSIRNQLRKEKRDIDEQIRELNENKGKAIQDESQKIDKQISLLVAEKENLLDLVTELTKTRTSKRENYENKVENYDGFAAHLEAMSVLTAWEWDNKSGIMPSKIPAMWWAKWLITLLFIFIEIAPVLFKLMTEAGPYDDIMARIKHESAVREKKRISDVNDEINTAIKISSERNKSRLDAELKGNDELLKSIALAQADIAKRAVEKWKEEEIAKLDTSLSHIITTNQKATPAITDKFWVSSLDYSEYCFRNGQNQDLIIREANAFRTGTWKLNGTDLEINLEGKNTHYAVEKLTDKELELREKGANRKLGFTL